MSVRHIVSWKFSGTTEERSALAEALAASLEGLMGNVPSLLGVVAKPNGVAIDGNWDLVLIADFENEAGLAAYQVHPDHIQVGKRIKEVAVSRSAIDVIM